MFQNLLLASYETYELKMDVFKSGQSEELLLFLNKYNNSIDGNGKNSSLVWTD